MQEEFDFSRLQEEHSKALQASREKTEKWEQFNSDYGALQARLCTLPDQLTHDIMVPFGRCAFMHGTLYHTNELTVLLGDNWFVKTTAKHALEIAERRKKHVCEMLEKERQLFSDWESRYSFTEQFQAADHEDTVEIKEEYVPKAPGAEKVRKAWVPKRNVPPPRKVFPPGHASRKGPGDTEALPARLEQLRVQDEGVSKPVAKETTESAAPLRITISHGESSMAAAEEEGRSVRTEGGPGPLLFTTPGDIFSHTESDDEPIAMTTKQVKWGPNKLFDEKSEKSHDPPHRENPRPPARPKVTKPFTGQVVERSNPQSTMTPDPTQKRVSRFKSDRVKK